MPQTLSISHKDAGSVAWAIEGGVAKVRESKELDQEHEKARTASKSLSYKRRGTQ